MRANRDVCTPYLLRVHVRKDGGWGKEKRERRKAVSTDFAGVFQKGIHTHKPSQLLVKLPSSFGQALEGWKPSLLFSPNKNNIPAVVERGRGRRKKKEKPWVRKLPEPWHRATRVGRVSEKQR